MPLIAGAYLSPADHIERVRWYDGIERNVGDRLSLGPFAIAMDVDASRERNTHDIGELGEANVDGDGRHAEIPLDHANETPLLRVHPELRTRHVILLGANHPDPSSIQSIAPGDAVPHPCRVERLDRAVDSLREHVVPEERREVDAGAGGHPPTALEDREALLVANCAAFPAGRERRRPKAAGQRREG